MEKNISAFTVKKDSKGNNDIELRVYASIVKTDDGLVLHESYMPVHIITDYITPISPNHEEENGGIPAYPDLSIILGLLIGGTLLLRVRESSCKIDSIFKSKFG